VFPSFHFNENELLAFALVLLRVLSFLITWPVFSMYSVPQPLKVLLAVVITICLFPVINRTGLGSQPLGTDIAWLAMKELFTGLCIGYVTRFFFFAITIGGNIIATSMGLANAQVFNPALNMQSTPVEQFYVALGTLLFLSINGHHIFLTGLAQSFDLVPLSFHGTNLAIFADSGGLIQRTIEAGLKISAPIMVAIFFMNLAMGIIGKAVPQINVLVTSLPINIMVGFGVMIIMIPLFISQLDGLLAHMATEMMSVIKSM
jgi:flagellar biosynthetic protein FliR